MSKKIGIVVGSLRKESWNRKIANELIRLAPDGVEAEIVEIGDLALYNEDLDTDNPPAAWTTFRNKIKSKDAYLFVTPEYNRNTSGVLKNAIDVGSRPYGKSAWAGGKPGAVVSVTMGGFGAMGGNFGLRQSVIFLDINLMQQPEAYISTAQNLFTENGKLVESTEKFLTEFMSAFKKHIDKFS